MNKSVLLLCLNIALPLAAAQPAPLWLRDAKISPDGSTIAFTYKGDIFTVPVVGGDAVRVTSQPSYETTPIWSPDSKTLAFSSDRFGNADIFTVGKDGGQWTRLTYNSAAETPEAFTPDGKAVLYSASIQDPASSALFPSGRMTEVYSVPVTGGQSSQLLATPARNISWAPDGRSFVYEDVKGFEDQWRKHHTSSVTRDIWRYDLSSGKHKRLIGNPGEDLSPVDGGDALYFLSERTPSKSLNVYKAYGQDYTTVKPLTSFKTHPVRFLSLANNGTLAFTYDGELYTLAPGAKPAKVKVNINTDFPDELRKLSAAKGASGATPSPDGKSVAFLYRGDVYVTSVDYPTTKQISNTPEAEKHLSWGNDSTLYYVSERDGKYNIYRATWVRTSEEPDFAHATLIDEKPVFKADSHERTAPELSPDGKKLAFILDRTRLQVMDVESAKVKELTDGWTHRQRGGAFNFTWSPDSKWIALEIIDRKHDPYTDIALINVENGQLTNITNSGYFDENPKWIMDGNAIAFASERLGMRNHASWGSQMDIFYVFLNQEAFDRFKMSKEDRELADNSKKDKKDKDKKDKEKKDGDADVEPIVVELDGISDRQVRVSPISTGLGDFITDGDKVYFTSAADDGSFVWEYDTVEKELKMSREVSDESPYFGTSRDGKTLFLFGDSMRKFGSTLKPITYNATKMLDPAAERQYMFDNVVREEAERFYTADMHGVDWPALTAAYRKFLPHINNNYDFAEMLSEMLGELNVSHTGSGYRANSNAPAAERTSSLGLLYDMTYTGPGLKVAEVLPQGPFYGVEPEIKAGAIIETINGESITPEMPVDRLLADAAGVRTLIGIRDSKGEVHDVVVRPITVARHNQLLYDRWVKARAADVDRLSKGRLGYVHISSMNDDSFRKAYSDLLGKYNDREGVVIDIRWNGGGRLHEDIEVLLSGQKYFTQEVRGDETCDMPSRRWNKPSIMLIAEPCYSNAHGTPWVYSNRGLGKLIGMPVPGTMTSVNWVTMQDPSLYFGIPVVGYRLPDGGFLENRQLEPDVKVANSPEEIVAGYDRQLETAVKELLKDIDSKK